MKFRVGKIGGSTLKDIIVKRGNKRKIGFYQLIADRIATPPDDEDPMERGLRLESEAIAHFEKETGKKVHQDLVVWVMEENPSVYVSPDGWVEEEEYAGVEVKCLSSARHIQALIEQKVPGEYEEQAVQYFIVNPKFERLYMVFFDPRLSVKQFHYLVIERSQYAELIDKYLEDELTALAEVDRIVNEWTF